MSTKVVSSIVVSNGLVQSGTSVDSTANGQVLIRDAGALVFRALAGADISVQMSITSDTSGLKLVNDALAPGNNYYYGTDSSGAKGFFSLPQQSTVGYWKFSTTTTMGDPGSAYLRFNNAAASATTAIAIDPITNAGTDATNFLKTLVSGDSIYVQDQ